MPSLSHSDDGRGSVDSTQSRRSLDDNSQCRRVIRSVLDLIATLDVLGDWLQSDRLIRRFHLAEEGYVGSEQLSPENQADKTIEAATSVENLVKEYWGW